MHSQLRQSPGLRLLATLATLAAMSLAIAGCDGGNGGEQTQNGGSEPLVTISPESSTLEVNETLQLSASSSSGEPIEWSSNDTSVAFVEPGGLVTAVQPGQTTIVATGISSDHTARATITVEGTAIDTTNNPAIINQSPVAGTPQIEVETAAGEQFLLDDPAIRALHGEAPDLSSNQLDAKAFERNVTAMADRPSAARISLHADQTPIRNQGGRGLCVVHAVLAAVEARYAREGYGKLDLSEHYLQHLIKTTFLYNFANNNARHSRQVFENFLATGGGGNVYGALPLLQRYATCPEAERPYISSRNYGNANQTGDDPRVQWNDRSGAETQKEVSDFNMIQEEITIQTPASLSLTPLPQQALEKAVYGITGYQTVPNDQLHEAAWYEQQLSMDREVIIAANFITERRDGIVYPDDKGPNQSNAAHALCIIGYDRTDADEPYFIVKNSWGGSGYMKMSYEWLSTNHDGRITQAAVITGIRDPNKSGFRPWLYMGRWKMLTNGTPSTLDIHRDAGYYDQGRLGGQADNRLGAILESGTGAVSRVNGDIRNADETRPEEISFYADPVKPALDYEETRGTHWVGYLDNDDWTLTAGIATSPGGDQRPFYAVKGDLFNGVAANSTLNNNTFLGAWTIKHPEIEGRLEIRSVNAANNTFQGRYVTPDGHFIVVDGTANPQSQVFSFTFPGSFTEGGDFTGYIHAQALAAISGKHVVANDNESPYPMVLIRQGAADVTIDITSPQAGETFERGDVVQLKATVAKDGQTVNNPSVIWTSTGPYAPGESDAGTIIARGAQGSTKLPMGTQDIYATYTGGAASENARDIVTIIVNAGQGPSVNITKPADGAAIRDFQNPPEVTVSASGNATANDGTTLSGNELQWSYRETGSGNSFTAAGTGQSTQLSLRQDNCGGNSYDIQLTATDPNSGASNTAIVSVFIKAFGC